MFRDRLTPVVGYLAKCEIVEGLSRSRFTWPGYAGAMKRERSFFLWLVGAVAGAFALVGGAALIKHDNKLPLVVEDKVTGTRTPGLPSLPFPGGPGTAVFPDGVKKGVRVVLVPGKPCEVKTATGTMKGSLFETPDGSKLCLPQPPIASG